MQRYICVCVRSRCEQKNEENVVVFLVLLMNFSHGWLVNIIFFMLYVKSCEFISEIFCIK